MTSPDIAAVPTLTGRELDAAVHEYVFGKPVKCLHLKTTLVKPKISRLRRCDDCGKEFGDTTYAMAVSVVPDYSTEEGPSFFAMLRAVRERGWTSIEMHVSFIDGEAHWIVEIVCGRGPCELHGNPIEDAHGVEGRGDTLPLAFARAALAAALRMET